jgi:hypothetical protein
MRSRNPCPANLEPFVPQADIAERRRTDCAPVGTIDQRERDRRASPLSGFELLAPDVESPEYEWAAGHVVVEARLTTRLEVRQMREDERRQRNRRPDEFDRSR